MTMHRTTVSHTRLGLALLGLAVMILAPCAGPAAAAATGNFSVMNHTVAPAGAPVPAAFTIHTVCTQPSGSSIVQHTANDGVGGPITAPNSCTVSENPLPHVLRLRACNFQNATWHIAVTPAQPVSVPVGGGWTYVTVTNTLTCDPLTQGTLGTVNRPGGHLVVFKDVVDTIGAPAPSAYAIVVNCTPNGPTNTLTVVQGHSTMMPTLIAAGSVCTASEALPPPPQNVPACNGGGATWSTSYAPQSVSIAPLATSQIRVTNTLTCARGKGQLKIVKTAINATGAPTALPSSFAMTLNCPLSGSRAISVPTGGALGIAAVSAPDSCALTENAPPLLHVEGCHGGSASWHATISPSPIPVFANQTTTVSVRNVLTCDKPQPGAPVRPDREKASPRDRDADQKRGTPGGN